MDFNREELSILANSARNIYFFASFVKIIHPVRGAIQFDLYPFQKRVLWEFLNNRFNIVLKARQMGLTELIALYVLWLALFNINKNIVIISLKDRVAKRVLKRIKHMYRHLPRVLQTPIVNGRSTELGTASEMEFANGSIITSIPTTEDAGRSEAVSLLVIDEAAIMPYAETIWTAAAPTLFTGGSAILNSTPLGLGNFYHSQWVDAITGSNGFNAIQIPWHLHPDRDQAWYDHMKQVLGARRAAQEIDCDFLSSGNNVFDPLDIKAMQDMLPDYPVIREEMNGNLLIFEEPIPHKTYFMGSDVSTGRAKDYSAFSIMDETGDEKACFKGRIPTNRLRNLLGDLGMKYNQALIAPERNDVGEAVVMGLEEQGYPNLYYTIRTLKKKGESEPEEEKVPGWLTSGKTRPIILDGLERDVREDLVRIKSPYFIAETYTFVYDQSNRPVAMNKGEFSGEGNNTYADDAIMGTAITNHIRKGPNRSDPSNPV
jgi:hypothetical protein